MDHDPDESYRIRSLPALLTTQNHGDDAAEASDDFAKAMEAVALYLGRFGGTAKAVQKLTITYVGDARGVDVTIASELTLPKRPKPDKTRYFLTPDSKGLTLSDPARGTLFEGENLGRLQRGRPA